jgi:hypothetical protein
MWSRSALGGAIEVRHQLHRSIANQLHERIEARAPQTTTRHLVEVVCRFP